MFGLVFFLPVRPSWCSYCRFPHPSIFCPCSMWRCQLLAPMVGLNPCVEYLMTFTPQVNRQYILFSPALAFSGYPESLSRHHMKLPVFSLSVPRGQVSFRYPRSCTRYICVFVYNLYKNLCARGQCFAFFCLFILTICTRWVVAPGSLLKSLTMPALQMSDYATNFAELPFHRSELKFGGYIRDGRPDSISYVQTVAESYGLKVRSCVVSRAFTPAYFFSVTVLLVGLRNTERKKKIWWQCPAADR